MHSADPRARNILFGLLVKLVITSPCHGEDHGFKSRRDREVGRSGCMPTAIAKEYKE